MEMARIQAVATSHSGGDVDKWPRLFSVSKSGGGGGECSLNRSLITQGRRMVYMRKDIFFT